MKNILIVTLIALVLGVSVYFYIDKNKPETTAVNLVNKDTTEPTVNTIPSTNTPITTPVQVKKTETELGSSVNKNTITAYHFGSGGDELLFIGGIHGGYEWNTSLVAYELIDYLTSHKESIPANIRVTVIPVLNPDGLQKVTGVPGRFTAKDVSSKEATVIAGRFNAHTVDLNRNFDCQWKKQGVWQTTPVSGGSAPFSEPESLAIKNYINTTTPKAVVVWYSAGGGVYSSSCQKGVLPETNTITKLFGQASGYEAHQTFDAYETSGDMVNWFAKNNIPAISVLLTNHTDTEWSRNLKGVEALFKHYTK
jgi:hypothetical protein